MYDKQSEMYRFELGLTALREKHYGSRTALCMTEETQNTELLLMCLLSNHLTFIKESDSSSFLFYFFSNTIYKNYTSLFWIHFHFGEVVTLLNLTTILGDYSYANSFKRFLQLFFFSNRYSFL